MHKLLAADDENQRALGIDYLMNVDDWQQHEDIVAALVQLFESPEATASEQRSILWHFSTVNLLPRIEATALRLADEHGDAERAHAVASMLLVAYEHDEATLVQFAKSDVRALREEAARYADDCSVDIFLSVAKDTSEPAWVRGEAIEHLAACRPDANTHAALIELSQPANWFFGAPGNHFPIHSLARVIDGLKKDPAGRERLLSLRKELVGLRGEREYVEWILDGALGKERGNFHGPVEPQ